MSSPNADAPMPSPELEAAGAPPPGAEGAPGGGPSPEMIQGTAVGLAKMTGTGLNMIFSRNGWPALQPDEEKAWEELWFVEVTMRPWLAGAVPPEVAIILATVGFISLRKAKAAELENAKPVT